MSLSKWDISLLEMPEVGTDKTDKTPIPDGKGLGDELTKPTKPVVSVLSVHNIGISKKSISENERLFWRTDRSLSQISDLGRAPDWLAGYKPDMWRHCMELWYKAKDYNCDSETYLIKLNDWEKYELQCYEEYCQHKKTVVLL